jgi:hypothetical protein
MSPLDVNMANTVPVLHMLEQPPHVRSFAAGVVFYLISIGLVAAATVGVFFGTGFLLLVQPAGETISGATTLGQGLEVEPLSDARWPSSSGDDPPVDGQLGSDGSKPVAPAVSQAVTDEAPPVGRTDAEHNTAALPSAEETPTSAATDIRSGSEPPAGPSTATPESAASVQSSVTDEAAQIWPATPTPAPQRTLLSAAEISDLLGQGDAHLRNGEVASARLFYQRAADAGNGRAALRLGATFDPAFLGRAGLRKLRGDMAEARLWYRRALALGMAEAGQRLENSEVREGRSSP